MLSTADLQMWKKSVCLSGCLGLTKVCVTVQWMITQYVTGYRECEDSRDKDVGYFAGQEQKINAVVFILRICRNVTASHKVDKLNKTVVIWDC